MLKIWEKHPTLYWNFEPPVCALQFTEHAAKFLKKPAKAILLFFHRDSTTVKDSLAEPFLVIFPVVDSLQQFPGWRWWEAQTRGLQRSVPIYGIFTPASSERCMSGRSI